MVRQRKAGKHTPEYSKGHQEKSKFSRRRGNELSFGPVLVLAAIFVGLPFSLFGGYKLWHYRLSSRVNTQLNAPLVVNQSESDMGRFWGSYRSNLYFGLR